MVALQLSLNNLTVNPEKFFESPPLRITLIQNY